MPDFIPPIEKWTVAAADLFTAVQWDVSFPHWGNVMFRITKAAFDRVEQLPALLRAEGGAARWLWTLP